MMLHIGKHLSALWTIKLLSEIREFLVTGICKN